MNLMLSVILLFVLVGLLAPRFGKREHAILAALATLMTGLYFFSTRFM